MPSYQLQPARTGRVWWATVGVTIAVLVIPFLLWAVAPPVQSDTGSERVLLGTGERRIETDLQCEPDLFATGGVGWYCGDLSLGTISQPLSDDPDHNLRRMVRAFASTGMPDEPIETVGEARVLVVEDFGLTIGMSVQTEEEQIFAVVTGYDYLGPEVRAETIALADKVFRDMSGHELPASISQVHMQAPPELDFLPRGENL